MLENARSVMGSTAEITNGVMPYQSLRELRTRVGSMLDDNLVSGVPNGELKRLYGALSADLEAAANASGASREFSRQNVYYKRRMDRIEHVLDRVLGNGRTPEQIFETFMPSNPDQSATVRATLRSLAPAERKIVSDAVVQRLGRSTPGRQNDVGDVWSSETFLTNWNRMSNGAKAQILPDARHRSHLEAVATVASEMRQGARVFANPSGTAGAAAPYGLGALAVTGNLGAAVAMIGSAYIGARMLTSPRVVQWLARAPRIQDRNAADYLRRLAVIYNESKDEALREELDGFMSAIGQGSQQQ